jgi:LacI family transcriptional regulator
VARSVSRPSHRSCPPPGPRVTLRFLADQLGLSPASISLVLNAAPAARAIPVATQERILAAARRFGYRPNSLARSLRRQRSFTIGVIVPDIGDGYAALVMSGIEDLLLREGYLYFVASHRRRADLLDEYPRLLLDRSVEGLIAIDTPWTKPLQIPVVSVAGHARTQGVTNIVLNHTHAADLAMDHLLGLGHRDIAVIKGQSVSSDTEVRWRAIQRAAARRRVRIDPALTVALHEDSASPEVGYGATRTLLGTGRRFTALVAFDDISAIGGIRALHDAGLRVPDDVSVIGFDDIPSAAFHNPGLTTVRQPLRRMGELAASIVLERIVAPGAPRAVPEVMVEPELIVRGSTSARPGRRSRGGHSTSSALTTPSSAT